MAKKDVNQLAKFITDAATGEIEDTNKEKKDQDKPVKGRSGGLVGGKARAEKLSPKRRKEVAQKAASTRWNKSA